jgi:hypothetical protein
MTVAAKNDVVLHDLERRGFFRPQPEVWESGQNASDLKTALWDIPDFGKNFGSDAWNQTHLLLLGLMHDAVGDEVKMELLFSLLWQKKAAFHAAPERDLLMKVLARDERLFAYLEKEWFFQT